jgi:hypothetical protein
VDNLEIEDEDNDLDLESEEEDGNDKYDILWSLLYIHNIVWSIKYMQKIRFYEYMLNLVAQGCVCRHVLLLQSLHVQPQINKIIQAEFWAGLHDVTSGIPGACKGLTTWT